MPGYTERSSVQSHTEYTHSRFRCPKCGTAVPKDEIDGGLCVKCRTIS